MKPDSVIELARTHHQDFLNQRKQIEIVDSWIRNEQPTSETFVPDEHRWSTEYEEIAAYSRTPWARLVVRSLNQTLKLSGMRAPKSKDNMQAWSLLQANNWDARQIPLHWAAIGHGLAFASVRPGQLPFGGGAAPIVNVHSGMAMSAYYDDDRDWPLSAHHAEPYTDLAKGVDGYNVQVVDETAYHYLGCRGTGLGKDDWTFKESRPHGYGLCPVVRYAPWMDTEGGTGSEIEPLIPVLRRIDQATFERLVVSRYGAWRVRWVTGLQPPDDATEDEIEAKYQDLRIQDMMVFDGTGTKVGTLEPTDITGYHASEKRNISDLAATSQTPSHLLLGLESNLAPESLQAAQDGLNHKRDEAQVTLGEQHENLARLLAHAVGNVPESREFAAQAIWGDTSTRSFVQTSQALATAALSLKIPVEMLWERLPSWTDNDTERALELIKGGDTVADLLAKLAVDAQPAPPKRTGGSDNEEKPE